MSEVWLKLCCGPVRATQNMHPHWTKTYWFITLELLHRKFPKPLRGFIIWVKKSLKKTPQTVVNVASKLFWHFTFYSVQRNWSFVETEGPGLITQVLLTSHQTNTTQTKLWFLNTLTIVDKPCNFILTEFRNIELLPCLFLCRNAYQCPRYKKR